MLKIVNVAINKETNETDWRSRWNRWVATNIHLDHRMCFGSYFPTLLLAHRFKSSELYPLR